MVPYVVHRTRFGGLMSDLAKPIEASAWNGTRPVPYSGELPGELSTQDGTVRHCRDRVGATAEENDPLHQAKLQIEALIGSNRRKDEFLATLSHELRSPLASAHYAVRSLRRLIREASAEPVQALIERQLGRMTHIVDELLDLSRINSGHLHLRCDRVDLCVVVSRALETLDWDIQERNHRLAIELPVVAVWVMADPWRMEQVFVNLLANASRYMDPGGQLSVRVQTGRGEVFVRIRDSGIGIAPDALPHIFELFQQANLADPRSGAGLGIGLAVVRNIVELHRGSVTAASAGVGQGSEFIVCLPAQ